MRYRQLMLLLGVCWTKGHKSTVVFNHFELVGFSNVARPLVGLLRGRLTGRLLSPLLCKALVL